MTGQLLNILGARHPLRKGDAGEFAALKANGMNFTVEAYEAEGLGHVSVMRAKGFFGLMQMDTLIVNPTERDLPLYSYDRILAMGNDTLIAELYDTTVGGFSSPEMEALLSRSAALPERDPGTHWYDHIRLPQSISKKGKKAHRQAFDRLALDHFTAWLNADCPPLTDPAAKRAKAAAYVDGLLTHGGPSTDVFKKALGQEKTERLFRAVLFGTE
jgi:hypothetical protein